MKGCVYILTNDDMPGLVKIGRTSRGVDIRAAELWQTGVPSQFEVFWSCKTPDCVELEALVHRDLRNQRVSRVREFFRVDPWFAQERIRVWAHIQAVEWAWDNFEEHTATHLSEASATHAIEGISADTGHSASVVAGAFGRISVSEISPALQREILERQRQADALSALADADDEGSESNE